MTMTKKCSFKRSYERLCRFMRGLRASRPLARPVRRRIPRRCLKRSTGEEESSEVSRDGGDLDMEHVGANVGSRAGRSGERVVRLQRGRRFREGPILDRLLPRT